MCFNATTSLITFSISVICFIYLLYYGLKTKNKNDIFLSILTILIGFMQLIEYLLWKDQSCDKNTNTNGLNHYASLFIIVVLYLQVVVMNILYFYLFPGRKTIDINIVIFCIALFSLFTMYLLSYLNKQQLCSMPAKKSCRLAWAPFTFLNTHNRLFISIFLFFYFLLILFIYVNSYNTNFLTEYPLRYRFLFITFIFAAIYTIVKETSKKMNIFNFYNYSDVFSSIWCFMAVFIGIIGVLRW